MLRFWKKKNPPQADASTFASRLVDSKRQLPPDDELASGGTSADDQRASIEADSIGTAESGPQALPEATARPPIDSVPDSSTAAYRRERHQDEIDTESEQLSRASSASASQASAAGSDPKPVQSQSRQADAAPSWPPPEVVPVTSMMPEPDPLLRAAPSQPVTSPSEGKAERSPAAPAAADSRQDPAAAPMPSSAPPVAPPPPQSAPVAPPPDPASAPVASAPEQNFAAAAAKVATSEAASAASWRDRLSGSSLTRGLRQLFQRNPRLDDDLLDDLETCLLTSDVGVKATMKLVEDLRRRMNKREFADSVALLAALRADLAAMVEPLAQPLEARSVAGPFVVLVVGVNGVGKTTTIGKLAHHYKQQGRKVMLAAGDTFRAAAVDQLKNWGQRNDVPVISQGQDADSASVIFDAVGAAKARGIDVLIADTAGRLHTQSNLMEELKKIRRVISRVDASAPHEVLQIIDGTTGQNAIAQVQQFREAAGVSGLVVTKLDGTAKGGVVFALAREFGLPLRFIGVGEKREDLHPFDAKAFVAAMLPDSLGTAAPGANPS